ncbi:type II secretion system minor pseudopilin GspI [Parendozoicomonas haliclonae]|uniref:type II secretion system minor pseudopilin GspI n=1 Tax=Parendozoicomonas haliclonae TaxID=1960125 RepID=UPI0013FDBD4C|nr:type II secretion system minor pseudopilin GspI [Parendozoicomonas haliclonae]
MDRLPAHEPPGHVTNRRQRSSGFTLLEVLIALAVFALAASALLVTDGRAIKQTARIQELVQASWLAENHLNRYYVEENFPPTGKRATSVEQNGKSWTVRDLVTETGQTNLRKVEVQVFAGARKPADKAKPLYRLTGYVRRPVNDK